MCYGGANLGYSGTTLVNVLWTSYFGLLKDHFGECAVEELLWPTQGPFWRVCCGKATLSYSGLAVEELLLWATQGSLWRVCCGRATLACSGSVLCGLLLRDDFCECAVEEPLRLLSDHFGECVVEKLLWATQDFGYSGITLVSVL